MEKKAALQPDIRSARHQMGIWTNTFVVRSDEAEEDILKVITSQIITSHRGDVALFVPGFSLSGGGSAFDDERMLFRGRVSAAPRCRCRIAFSILLLPNSDAGPPAVGRWALCGLWSTRALKSSTTARNWLEMRERRVKKIRWTGYFEMW